MTAVFVVSTKEEQWGHWEGTNEQLTGFCKLQGLSSTQLQFGPIIAVIAK